MSTNDCTVWSNREAGYFGDKSLVKLLWVTAQYDMKEDYTVVL